MMTVTILVWYILTLFPDTPVCALWVASTPTPAQFAAACRGYRLENLRLDVYTLNGDIYCHDLPATDIYLMHVHCTHQEPLDQFTMRLFIPAHEQLTCSISVTHEGPPTPDEIARQCGLQAASDIAYGSARVIFSRNLTITPPPSKCVAPLLPTGSGLYDQAPSATALYTSTLYELLAQRLIWFGIVRPECDGFSGLDGYTLAPTPCGLAHARLKVTEWQNRWDADIYAAALQYQVPARMLKRMMGIESQFWPLFVGTVGEMSVMQITENGADVLLRYDPTLDTLYLSRDERINFWRRLAVRNSFHCFNCDLQEAINHTTQSIPMYARLLAAYRCRAVSIDPTLGGVPAWQQAAIDYNGSEDYLTKLESVQ